MRRVALGLWAVLAVGVALNMARGQEGIGPSETKPPAAPSSESAPEQSGSGKLATDKN